MRREDRDIDDAMRQLGARIRDLRRKRDMTIVQLAEASGLSRGFVGELEVGQRAASLAALARIAKALGTTVVEILRDIPGYNGGPSAD